MALAGVQDRQTQRPPDRQQAAIGLDGAAKLRHVVAEHFAEAAGLEEVALHVDDQKRAALGRQREGIGLGCDVHRSRFPLSFAESRMRAIIMYAISRFCMPILSFCMLKLGAMAAQEFRRERAGRARESTANPRRRRRPSAWPIRSPTPSCRASSRPASVSTRRRWPSASACRARRCAKRSGCSPRPA